MTDLDELEKLEQAATMGPWKLESECETSDDDHQFYGLDKGDYPRWLLIEGMHWSFFWDEADEKHYDTSARDAALIVAARNALPALIAELRELRKENERLRETRRVKDIIAEEDK